MSRFASLDYQNKLMFLKDLFNNQHDLWIKVNPKRMSTPRWRVLVGLAGDPEAEEYLDDLYSQIQRRLPAAKKELEKEQAQAQEQLKYEGQGVEIDSYDPPSLRSLRGKKVWLYHGTSTFFDDLVKKYGLQPSTSEYVSGARGKSVFLTARPYGSVSSAEFYAKKAVGKYGGDPVIYRVLVEGSRLRPDPDDADISSGRYQYIIKEVRPRDIKERHKMGAQKVGMLTPCFEDVHQLYLRIREITKKKPDQLQGPDYDEAYTLAKEMSLLANDLYSKVGYGLRDQAERYRDFSDFVVAAIDIGDLKSLPKLKVEINPDIKSYYHLPDKPTGIRVACRVARRYLAKLQEKDLQEK